MNYKQLIAIPGRDSINTKCSSVRSLSMIKLMGKPDIAEGVCPLPTETIDCGPFRATGYRPFLLVVSKVMDVIKAADSDLYEQIGSAGCLNVRKVRGGNYPSNHSWGCAIDLTIGGELCPRGSGMTQVGLLEVYKYAKRWSLASGQWLYWGAGFNTDDAMHFEASYELVKKWAGK